MSSDEKTASKSIFAKPPVKIVVSSDERVYYVHRGTLEVHKAFDTRLKESTDEYEEAIDWSRFDEQTIDCVLSFLYTAGYQAPQPTSVAVEEDEADAGEEAPAQDGEEGEQEQVVVDEADEENDTKIKHIKIEPNSPPDSPRSQASWPRSPSPSFPPRTRSPSPVPEPSIAPNSPPTQAMSDCDLNDRPLTPLEYCDGVTLATERASGQKVEDQDQEEEPQQETEGNSAPEIYLHAKVYSFARQLDFAKLEQFALNRLTEVLVALEQTDKVLFPYLVDAIRLVYKTTSAVDDARNLLSQFVALRYTTLVGEDLDELLTEGGEFVVDLSHKLARKLTAIEMVLKRDENLAQRNEELRAESAEKDEELKTLREEVRHGPTHGFPAFSFWPITARVPDYRRHWNDRRSSPLEPLWGKQYSALRHSTMIPRSFLRARALLVALTLAVFLAWAILTQVKAYIPNLSSQTTADLTSSHREFWREFHALLEKFAPDTNPIIEYEKASTEGFHAHNPPPRPDALHVPDEEIATMKEAHAGFVNAINGSPPELPYLPDTKGIVSTAGGTYLPVLVISLRMLRRTGSTLPMEVFLADEDEYEHHICDVVLPSLNARCVVLSRILIAAPARIQKYQFKPFAMIFSSFEEILFLDADAFPLEKPEQLFITEPFLAKGMVTWPDFWASSVSPLFYDIANYPPPPMDLRQSTESGEVLLSKRSHLRSLLLATYYNYHGPSHYYALLSQGAAGEGDKETFVTAAAAMHESFHQVSEPICALGHETHAGIAGSAMAQFNPVQDFALTSREIWRVRGDDAPAPDVFFIHANFPKFNPATIFELHEVNPAFTDEGEFTRAWTLPVDVVRGLNSRVDVEKGFWEEILWTACELEDKFRSWVGFEGICDAVKKYWGAVFGVD
ncbi:Alpha-mannosyltransferase [Penicillium italicum]|uniref:Alpha-mannosyltransferase n=1 Tax=Penicillium italicum TaxID=40296 RepID=A0A0A2KG73_PENIT|nr:Alpha-mannosyltransferase [Penicillium italicum]